MNEQSTITANFKKQNSLGIRGEKCSIFPYVFSDFLSDFLFPDEVISPNVSYTSKKCGSDNLNILTLFLGIRKKEAVKDNFKNFQGNFARISWAFNEKYKNFQGHSQIFEYIQETKLKLPMRTWVT